MKIRIGLGRHLGLNQDTSRIAILSGQLIYRRWPPTSHHVSSCPRHLRNGWYLYVQSVRRGSIQLNQVQPQEKNRAVTLHGLNVNHKCHHHEPISFFKRKGFVPPYGIWGGAFLRWSFRYMSIDSSYSDFEYGHAQDLCLVVLARISESYREFHEWNEWKFSNKVSRIRPVMPSG